MSKDSKTNSNLNRFTLDTTSSSEVPSISKLIQKKEVGLTGVTRVAPPAAPPSHPILTKPFKLISNFQQSKKQPIELVEIDSTRVEKAGNDPLAKGLKWIEQWGAFPALFLGIQPGPLSSKQPRFGATAIRNETNRRNAWLGLVWDPVLTPDLWNGFLNLGYIEVSSNFPSPGGVLLRRAFLANSQETVTLFRFGSQTSCKGALVLFSNESLKRHAQQFLEILGGETSYRKAA